MIANRDQARHDGNHALEQTLAKQVRACVQHDKSQWLTRLIENGDWSAIKQLRKKGPQTRIALRDQAGNTTSSELRANTLAECFESIQWAVRPISNMYSQDTLHDINVHCGPISFRELIIAVDKLKNGKQPGSDDVPSEFWKAISLPGSNACNLLLFNPFGIKNKFQLHGN